MEYCVSSSYFKSVSRDDDLDTCYRLGDLIDMPAEDLTNQNLYDYCHAEDLQKLKKAHVDRE